MGEQGESLSSITMSKAYVELEAGLGNHLPPWKEASTSQRFHIFLLYLLICMPVFVLLFVVIGGYIFYLYFYIFELVRDNSDLPELYYWHTDSEHENARIRGLIFFSIQTWCLFWLLASHVRAMFTDPGQIPKVKEWDIPSDDDQESSDSSKHKLLEKTKKGYTRSCNRCQQKKPDRTHHCRQCDRCNLKMDHHCNWIANCVGYYNYKFFFLMVFYGSISLGLFIGTFWECVVVVLNDEDSSTDMCFIVVLVYSLIIMLGIAVIGFCWFHFWLISKNFTTIEYCEKKRKDVPGYTKSPFGLESTYKNFQECLGENPLLWIFPTSDKNPGGGLYYN